MPLRKCSRRFAVATFAVIAVPGLVSGCHSAYVSAAVTNETTAPVSLVEVDYPSASFGTDVLKAGSTYTYRFKILGSGASKVLWTDAHGEEHSSAGPDFHEGDEGRLNIELNATTAQFVFVRAKP